MVNGNLQKLVWGILGAILAITLGLSSTLFGMIREDIRDIETRMDQIQAEYYRISLMEEELKEIKELLKEDRR